MLPDRLREFTVATESFGFDAIGFTDHPAPPMAWVKSGGHVAFDPLPALAFCAAHSKRIRLMTYLLVLPYRNPLLTLKSLTTLDVLSAGRLTVVAGTGYLAGEFAALSVDFDERNDLTDEALTFLRGAWGRSAVRFEGRHFSAVDQALEPMPVQKRLPIWIGGNSRIARKRAALLGDGWSPLMGSSHQADRNRTAPIREIVDLKSAVGRMRDEAEEAGRDPNGISVQLDALDGPTVLAKDASTDELLEFAFRARGAGVNSLVLRPPAADYGQCLETLQRYGEDLLPHWHQL